VLHIRKESKQLKHVSELIEQIKISLQQNEYQKSKQLYKDIQQEFKQLKPEERIGVYSTLTELRYELDAKYVKERIDESNILLAHNQKGPASAVYKELTIVYKTLPPQYKKAIYKDCAELHKKICETK
jgi:hypothetical protein